MRPRSLHASRFGTLASARATSPPRAPEFNHYRTGGLRRTGGGYVIPAQSQSPRTTGRSLSPPWRQSTKVDASLRPTRSVSPYVRQQLTASYDDAVLAQAVQQHSNLCPKPHDQTWGRHRDPPQGLKQGKPQGWPEKLAASHYMEGSAAGSRFQAKAMQPGAQTPLPHYHSLADSTASAAAYVTVQPAREQRSASSDNTRAAAHQELARLPQTPQIFSQLDYQIMSSILQAAEQAAKVESQESTGNGQVGTAAHSSAALGALCPQH